MLFKGVDERRQLSWYTSQTSVMTSHITKEILKNRQCSIMSLQSICPLPENDNETNNNCREIKLFYESQKF